MNKKMFLVDVKETFKARIAVMAESEEDAEMTADELVGGGIVSIINLSRSCCSDSDYKKECEVVKTVDNYVGLPEGMKVYG